MRMRATFALGLLGCIGCTAGYRQVSVGDSRLGDVFLAGAHREIPLTEAGPRLSVSGLMGVLPASRVDSRSVSGGIDEWAGLLLEVEGGVQVPLMRSEGQTWWAGGGVEGGAFRMIEHLSGPSGRHDHPSDHHDVHVFGEFGAAARMGYSVDLLGQGSAVGIDLGVGISRIAGIGTGYFLEVRLLTLHW